MTPEEFQCISDADAEKQIGKTIIYTTQDGKQKVGRITDVIPQDPINIAQLHLQKATKYIGFEIDNSVNLSFCTNLISISIK